jgi:hypothetical protein
MNKAAQTDDMWMQYSVRECMRRDAGRSRGAQSTERREVEMVRGETQRSNGGAVVCTAVGTLAAGVDGEKRSGVSSKEGEQNHIWRGRGA